MNFSVPRLFLRDRRGNVAMLYALALPLLMFVTGMAIDYTRAMRVQTELDAAADAAVLAALTPSMMLQTNATAQAAAQNTFYGQIANISSLVCAQCATFSVTNPAGNTLERDVTVRFAGQNSNIFAGVLGVPTLPLAGTSTAKASLAANINFYLLLDNSPSMALPATTAGITQMQNLTSQQDGGAGCAFACHQATGNNGDTAGNLCLSSSGQYSAPTLTASMGSGGNTYCNVATQGPQIDNFAASRIGGTNGNGTPIQLRLDALSSGITDLMSDAQNAQNMAVATPPVYQFAAYEMDSSWQIGMANAANNNQLMALTTSFVSGWAAAKSNFGVMEYYSNNNECGNSACTLGGGGGDYATNYDDAFTTMNTLMPNPGGGTNIAGDSPQEVLFVITDGVEDEVNTTCSQPLTGTRCQAPLNPALCSTIKGRGIRIAVLYTDYYQVTSDQWYNSWVAPFQSTIASQLQACASPNLFYDAGIGSDLGVALQTLFNTVTQTAHLTN